MRTRQGAGECGVRVRGTCSPRGIPLVTCEYQVLFRRSIIKYCSVEFVVLVGIPLVTCVVCTHTRQKYPVRHCICQSHTKTTQLCSGVHSKKELPQFSNVVFAAPQCSMQASMSPGHGYPPSSPLTTRSTSARTAATGTRTQSRIRPPPKRATRSPSWRCP